MKKIIIFGSILSCFLLLMIPSINAIEYQNQKNIITSEKETIDSPYFVKIVKQLPKVELRTILKNITQILGKVLHVILAALYLLFSIVLHIIKATINLSFSTVFIIIKAALYLLFSIVLPIIKATLQLSFSTVFIIIKAALFLLFSVEIIIIIPFIIWAISSFLPQSYKYNNTNTPCSSRAL
jgi:hypothetical protein